MADSAEPRRIWAAYSLWIALLACLVAVCIAAAVPAASDLVATIRGGLSFDAAPLPVDYSHDAVIPVAERHSRALRGSERIGEGLLPGPEDLAYDPDTGFLYAGCVDGWIRRVRVGDPEAASPSGMAVEDWVYVGGRPLGLVFGSDKQLIVADAYKALHQDAIKVADEVIKNDYSNIFKCMVGLAIAAGDMPSWWTCMIILFLTIVHSILLYFAWLIKCRALEIFHDEGNLSTLGGLINKIHSHERSQ